MAWLMDRLFDKGFEYNVDFSKKESQQITKNKVSNISNQTSNNYDMTYSPILNLNSPNSSISPTTKKEMSSKQSIPIEVIPYTQNTDYVSKPNTSGGSSKNVVEKLMDNATGIAIIGVAGVVTYLVLSPKNPFKKKRK